jgi:hypothetical protein
MKSSLVAITLLMSVVASAQNIPPLTPIQLIPAAAVVKPTSSMKPAPSVNSNSDAEAVRKLRQAEAEFKANKPAVKVDVPSAKPATTVEPIIVVAKPPKPAAAKPVMPTEANNQQLPSIRRPTRIVHVAPRPQSVSQSASRPQLWKTSKDVALLITNRCAASKKPVRCMNIQLNDAELRVDSAEVRLLNCREIRKFDTSLDATAVDSLVTGRMYMLRFKETQNFNAQLARSGRLSKMQTKELELRATIAHLKAVLALDEKVCSATEFAKLYEAAKSSN